MNGVVDTESSASRIETSTATIHTVEYDPFIKSQLASRKLLPLGSGPDSASTSNQHGGLPPVLFFFFIALKPRVE